MKMDVLASNQGLNGAGVKTRQAILTDIGNYRAINRLLFDESKMLLSRQDRLSLKFGKINDDQDAGHQDVPVEGPEEEAKDRLAWLKDGRDGASKWLSDAWGTAGRKRKKYWDSTTGAVSSGWHGAGRKRREYTDIVVVGAQNMGSNVRDGLRRAPGRAREQSLPTSWLIKTPAILTILGSLILPASPAVHDIGNFFSDGSTIRTLTNDHFITSNSDGDMPSSIETSYKLYMKAKAAKDKDQQAYDALAEGHWKKALAKEKLKTSNTTLNDREKDLRKAITDYLVEISSRVNQPQLVTAVDQLRADLTPDEATELTTLLGKLSKEHLPWKDFDTVFDQFMDKLLVNHVESPEKAEEIKKSVHEFKNDLYEQKPLNWYTWYWLSVVFLLSVVSIAAIPVLPTAGLAQGLLAMALMPSKRAYEKNFMNATLDPDGIWRVTQEGYINGLTAHQPDRTRITLEDFSPSTSLGAFSGKVMNILQQHPVTSVTRAVNNDEVLELVRQPALGVTNLTNTIAGKFISQFSIGPVNPQNEITKIRQLLAGQAILHRTMQERDLDEDEEKLLLGRRELMRRILNIVGEDLPQVKAYAVVLNALKAQKPLRVGQMEYIKEQAEHESEGPDEHQKAVEKELWERTERAKVTLLLALNQLLVTDTRIAHQKAQLLRGLGNTLEMQVQWSDALWNANQLGRYSRNISPRLLEPVSNWDAQWNVFSKNFTNKVDECSKSSARGTAQIVLRSASPENAVEAFHAKLAVLMAFSQLMLFDKKALTSTS